MNKMKLVLTSLAILLLSCTFTFANPIKVISSSSERLVVEFTPDFLGFDTIPGTNGVFVAPRFSSVFMSEENSGNPAEFIYTGLVNLPTADGAEIESVEGVDLIKYKGVIVPAPIRNGEKLTYTADYLKFSQSKLREWAKLAYTGISLERHTARLAINAVNYTSDSTIIIPTKIRISIKFNPATAKYSKRGSNSLGLNPEQGLEWQLAKSNAPSILSGIPDLSKMSNGNWAKVTINDLGIQKIDAATLSAKGIAVSADMVNTIKVFGRTGNQLAESQSEIENNFPKEIPVIRKTKQSGELDYILFYAEPANGWYSNGINSTHYLNPFSFNNSYLITCGGTEGKSFTTEPAAQGDIVNSPNYYLAGTFFEEELTNPYNEGSGRSWFGRSYFASPFIVSLPNLYRDGQIRFNTAVAHKAASDETNPATGTFKIKVGGNTVATTILQGLSGDYDVARRNVLKINLDASQIPSDNRMVIDYDYSNTKASAIPYFDYYEILYPRELVANDNEVSVFFDNSYKGVTEYKFNGFSGYELYGMDVTNTLEPKLLTNTTSTGGMFNFKTDIQKNNNRYYIAGKFRSPSVEKIELKYLSKTNSDKPVIIVTHKDLLASAKEFAEYREKQSGLKSEIFITEDIYNEFGAGVSEPAAIRDFVAYCYNNWSVKPKYLVLWGDGHYDYRGISYKVTNYIPTYQTGDESYTLAETSAYATDDFFVKVANSEAAPDLATGRVPVGSNSAGRIFIQKLNIYENESSKDSWRANALLTADDGRTHDQVDEGPEYTGHSELIANLSVPYLQEKKIYLIQYPTVAVANGRRKPRATEALVAATTTSGAVLWNWAGHGNPRILAHEQFFERETTIPKMNNLDKLFFMTAFTCDFARFDKDGAASAAEELVMSKIGGAIGVVAAVRVVNSSPNKVLNEEYYKQLFTRDINTGLYPTVGIAMLNTKQDKNGDNDMRYLILGDPTMKLLYPDYRASLDSIDGIAITDSVFGLKALSTIKLVGSIKTPKGDKIDEAFNGKAVITLLDGDENIFITENSRDYYFWVPGGALNKSTVEVVNGRWTAEIVIPQDISFSDKNARFYVYASSDDNKYAAGSTSSLIVNGINPTAVNDGKGPDIDIYFDSRDFKPGDLVRATPLLIADLNDETGINSSGLGIGHRIEAWIDGETTPIDLTSYYTSSVDNPKGGSVQNLLFGLSEGTHRIVIRAWDVFNNYSTAETYFTIPGNGDESIGTVLMCPNPFIEGGTIRVRHNVNPPYELELGIYNASGMLVRTLKADMTATHTAEIVWDGRDNDGKDIAGGAYYFRASITTNDKNVIKHGVLGIKAK